MVRCVACDKNLSDYESTRKNLSGEYIDMCNHCYGTIKDDLLTVDREDLLTAEEAVDDDPFEFYEDN